MFSFLTKKKVSQSGFSVVEMVVVLTIFAIMSGVSMFNYNDYRKKIEKTNVSQDIALSIRQAQVYGISSSDRTVGDEALDSSTHADELFSVIDITRDKSIRGVVIFPEEGKIILYEDLDRNFEYNEDDDRVIDERSIVNNSIEIVGTHLCSSGEPECENLQTGQVDISFKRPYPEAYIRYEGSNYAFATIVVSSDSDNDHYIKISSIGNIAVTDTYQ